MKHLWAADAGIVFMPLLDGSDALGRNIPHEYGFLEGQGKPAMVLVESGGRAELDSWTNIAGIYVQHFASGHQAADRADGDSIYAHTVRCAVDEVKRAFGDVAEVAFRVYGGWIDERGVHSSKAQWLLTGLAWYRGRFSGTIVKPSLVTLRGPHLRGFLFAMVLLPASNAPQRCSPRTFGVVSSFLRN